MQIRHLNLRKDKLAAHNNSQQEEWRCQSEVLMFHLILLNQNLSANKISQKD